LPTGQEVARLRRDFILWVIAVLAQIEAENLKKSESRAC